MSIQVLKERNRYALYSVETTGKEGFTFGHGSSDAPIVVSNASSIASPITHPHLKEKMAKADSISGVSETSSIFDSEQDGRCIVLREKRQHISTLYAKWASQHAKYAHYSREDIDNDGEVYDDVSDIDLQRNLICLAINDFVNHARKVFDMADIGDRCKLYYVAKNCERKRLQMEKRPLRLGGLDELETESCRLPTQWDIFPYVGSPNGANLDPYAVSGAKKNASFAPLFDQYRRESPRFGF